MIEETWMSTHAPDRFAIDLIVFALKLLALILLVLYIGEQAWGAASGLSITMPASPADRIADLFAEINDQFQKAVR